VIIAFVTDIDEVDTKNRGENMNTNLECIYCTLKKADSMFSKYEESEEKKVQFMKKVFSIIGKSKEDDTSPFLNGEIMRSLNEELNTGDMYYKIKKEYNKLLSSMEEDIFKNIYSSEDKLLTALKYAMVGNFIDFGAMDTVNVEQLKKLIESAPRQSIDMKIYEKFSHELENIKKITYIVDNAGEIVFDKIFIRMIQELYPDINISVVVRGEPIYNDATISDAEEIGLVNMVKVIGNGTNIPGTQLNKINEESKEIIDGADLIIAKGQGNFESLFGCDKNIYYIFLCKCDLFVRRFNIEKFKGIFANEEDIKDMMV
jgi:damage-control phosphatase, subfamily I